MRTRLWLTVVFGFALAPACGKSAHHGGQPASGEAGADGGSVEPGGGASAGTVSGAGTSSGGVGVAGEPDVAGEPSVDGGTAGNIGAGGAPGGAGGAENPPLPSPLCDDGNPCTLDSFGAAGCQHAPVADGQLCEDGSFCTLGDHCAAGACVPGAAQTGPGGALGKLSTYGNGLAMTPGGKRFAFVDAPALPVQLTLADVDANGVLQARDRAEVDQATGYSFIGTAWDDVIALADGDTSFGLNGPSRNMQLFSIEANGALTPHSVVPITPGSQTNPANASMVGRGSRLFLCHNWSFFSAPAGTLMWWDVSDLDAPVLIAQGSTRGQCGSIAASEDGSRVYVNTVNGVIWTDLSTWISGDLTFAADPLQPTDAGLSLRGDRLVTRSGETIRVFDESDHSLLATFTATGANSAALMDAGIFVQSDAAADGGTKNTIALYDLSGQPIRNQNVVNLPYARDLTSQRLVANETYAIDSFSHRLFAVGANGFSEVEEPGVGALGWAFSGQDALHTRSNSSAHRIDVSDPSAPAILAGGPTRSPNLSIKLDLSLTPASLVSETDPAPSYFSGADPATIAVNALWGHQTETVVQGVRADADEHYDSQPSFTLPGGDATLLSAGDFVYRAAYVTTGNVHLQRWLVSDLTSGLETPQMDLEFEAPAGAANSTLVRFDVDPNARTAVLTTLWNGVGSVVGKMYWIDLATDPPTVDAAVSGNAVTVRIRGDRLVYSENTAAGCTLHFQQRGSDSEATFALDERLTRLLGFDGTSVYYAVVNGLRAVTNRAGGPAASLDLPFAGTPSSLTAMPGSLVATSAAQLQTFAPVCN